MLKNILKISDTTMIEVFELKLLQGDQRKLKTYCRGDLGSVWDAFTCWLSICVLTQGFLEIQTTMLFTAYYFENTSGMRLIFFFFKMFEMLCRFEKRKKDIDKMFWVYEIIGFELLVFNTLFYRERILVIGSQ